MTSTDGRNVPAGVTLYSVGYTTLTEGTALRWADALPDPDARANLEALAAQVAAGVVAELDAGRDLNSLEHRDDFYQMVQIGGALGYGSSSTDPAMQSWMKAVTERAAELLAVDAGEAWDRVTVALLRKGRLSGEEVGALVNQSI